MIKNHTLSYTRSYVQKNKTNQLRPGTEYNPLVIWHISCSAADVTASNSTLEIGQYTNSITDEVYIKAEVLSIHDV